MKADCSRSRPVPVKLKRPSVAGSNCNGIGDCVLQRLVHRTVDPIHSKLHIVVSVMPRQAGSRVPFPKSAPQRHQNRSGAGIRPQTCGVVTHAALGVEQQRRRDDALIVDQTAGLPIRTVLPLSGILLQEFVGNLETHLMPAHRDPNPVATGEIARISHNSTIRRSSVGEVVEYWRIQIAVRLRAGNVGGHAVRPATIDEARVAIHGPKTSASDCGLAVQAVRSVLGRRDLHHAAQLAPILSGISSRKDAHGLHVFRLETGRKCRRPVLVQGHAIHDELDIVLRSPGMQHAVGFIKPSWLGIDQVEQAPARLRSKVLCDGLRSDRIHGGGAIGIDQRRGIGYIHAALDRSHPQGDAQVHGDFRTDTDDPAECLKALVRNHHPV